MSRSHFKRDHPNSLYQFTRRYSCLFSKDNKRVRANVWKIQRTHSYNFYKSPVKTYFILFLSLHLLCANRCKLMHDYHCWNRIIKKNRADYTILAMLYLRGLHQQVTICWNGNYQYFSALFAGSVYVWHMVTHAYIAMVIILRCSLLTHKNTHTHTKVRKEFLVGVSIIRMDISTGLCCSFDSFRCATNGQIFKLTNTECIRCWQVFEQTLDNYLNLAYNIPTCLEH